MRKRVDREIHGFLLDRIQPLVDAAAAELAELVLQRLQADLERTGDALKVAVSVFASELEHDDSDRRDHDPVPRLPRGPARGLPLDKGRQAPQPAQASNPRRGENERAARLVGKPDLIADTLGTVVAEMLTPAPKRVERAVEPDKVPPPARGKKRCSACGFVGGTKQGCGTAHQTQSALCTAPEGSRTMTGREAFGAGSQWGALDNVPIVELPRRPRADPDAEPLTAIGPRPAHKPTRDEIEALKARSRERVARIASRAESSRAAARTEPADNNENAEERWSASRIAEERELAEANKHEGELPEPLITFAFGAND